LQGWKLTLNFGCMVETETKLGLAAEVLDTFGHARLPVKGLSMLPAMWPGDLLEIQRHDPAEIGRGDVVVFRRDGRLVVHRVVRNGSNCLVTRGDHLTQQDAPVPLAEVLGRVTAIERRNRRINPRLTARTRMLSWLLGRSEFCTRLAMSLHRRLQA
jgi:signal peptidase I